jgi:multidrug efflux pump
MPTPTWAKPFNWNEPGKVLRIDIAQDKARQYGLSSEDVARK